MFHLNISRVFNSLYPDNIEFLLITLVIFQFDILRVLIKNGFIRIQEKIIVCNPRLEK